MAGLSCIGVVLEPMVLVGASLPVLLCAVATAKDTAVEMSVGLSAAVPANLTVQNTIQKSCLHFIMCTLPQHGIPARGSP